MSPLPPDPYKALGVDRTADSSAIRTAYRKLVLKCHPDKVQDPTLKATKQDEFQRVQQAYEILSDEKKRSEYDDDASLRKLRDELSRGMGRTAPGPRPTSNSYREPHIHTAEPRSSFKPGPPPTSPFMNYGSSGAQFAHTAEFAYRTKAYPESPHRGERRASSAEKAREDSKDTRRRRKDDEEYYEMPRERERERERDRERAREREREKERKTRAERETDDKKERPRREKERDRSRRQDQQEKSRSKKPVYMEEYSDPDGGLHLPKKMASGGLGPPPELGANSSSRRHTDSPRRGKSMPREPSPDPAFQSKYMSASDYIKSKRGISQTSPVPDNSHFAHGYTEPEYWPPSGDSPRPRRSSQDDKKMRGRAVVGDLPSNFKPPRLSKSYTSPASTLHMSSTAPRAPGLTRATTVSDYHKATLPEVPDLPPAPPVPLADPSRHSRKSSQRRRDYYGVYDDDISPAGHSPSQPRAYDASSPLPRGPKTSHYRADYYPTAGGSGRPLFEKVRESPMFSREQVYERKAFSEEDVNYSHVPHSYVPA
ncbi:hypothetical protein F503_00530 [Ophiostoma piceae UAMH 11346]|uniref:J domain-containing protein n=1 Tax=Ophiostoma piceae (strain UAMH 11346) TaxID=1262450 RepID=S3CMR7_OPHP1|nr:hypothetical protein F503_00530 [Ophiostoma piceae UAMH 11346]